MLIVGFCVFWQFSTLKGLNSCPLTLTSSGMQLQNFGHDTANTHFQGGHMLFSNSIYVNVKCHLILATLHGHFNYILHVTAMVWFTY